jgi:hypothetical protein
MQDVYAGSRSADGSRLPRIPPRRRAPSMADAPTTPVAIQPGS